MAIIANGMQPAQPQQPPQANPQGVVQRIVAAALMLLNTDQVEQHIVQLLKGGDPVQGLSQALVFVVQALADKAKGMPMQALGQAMPVILQHIAKIAQAAGVQVAPQMLQQAVQGAMQLLKQQAQQPAQPQPVAPGAPAAPTAQPQGV